MVVAILWQAFALYGPFPPKLFPTVDKIVSAFVRLTANGVLPIHALSTLLRLLACFIHERAHSIGRTAENRAQRRVCGPWRRM